PWPAEGVAGFAVPLDLRDVPAERTPALDLALIFVTQPPAKIVAAVPLEPAARILAMDPALAPPLRQRLAGVDVEVVELGIAALRRQLGLREPARREFLAAVGHVLAAEHAEPKHLGRRELRLEAGIEVAAGRRRQGIAIATLHPVVDGDDPLAAHRILHSS